ncbi:MAG: aspartate kinase [Clostridia bacterium]|nr:aspartate kinase [Clostridia bacterium]
MDTIIVLKFGGSSVADNIKLNVVAEKIISLKKEAKSIVVVVSAQGKTTDGLIKEAQELSAIPNEREMDMLLSTGEQITSAKLSILLNRMGHKAISLTGWQAGIITNNIHQSAKIEKIQTQRIEKELKEGKIVVVTGFQGITEDGDITTLGRGGSDTSAVALQAALNAEKCYIFSDVDGIYSADPNMITMAKRLNEISFDEMQEIADAGAKVLHNRCVQIGKKFDCNIIAKSTFSNEGGTRVCRGIETSEVKSIVRNDKLIQINLEFQNKVEEVEIYQELLAANIIVESFNANENFIKFIIKKAEETKVLELIERKYPNCKIDRKVVIKLSVVGYGIIQDNTILNKIIRVLKDNKIEIENINLTQSKIEIIAKELENKVLEILHKELIN